MKDLSTILIFFGIILVVFGLVYRYIGKLPGDIVISKGTFSFYFPIVSSIAVSIILTLILNIFKK